MKHCVIMTAYKDVDAVNRFILSTPVDWEIYIHVDKKSDIDNKINSRARIFKLKKIYWGAWEHIYVILYMIEIARKESDPDYFHIVSGQDYYAMPPYRIDEKTSVIEGLNYISVFPIPYAPWEKPWDWGYAICRYTTFASFGDVRFGIMRLLNGLLLKIQKNIPFLCRKLPSYKLYGSSVYCSLHRDFINYLCTDSESQKFIKGLKHTTCSEEVILATLIMNSPYKNLVESAYRYVDWSKNNLVLDQSDFHHIISSECFFCRKIDTKLSGTLVNSICKYIGLAHGIS